MYKLIISKKSGYSETEVVESISLKMSLADATYLALGLQNATEEIVVKIEPFVESADDYYEKWLK